MMSMYKVREEEGGNGPAQSAYFRQHAGRGRCKSAAAAAAPRCPRSLSMLHWAQARGWGVGVVSGKGRHVRIPTAPRKVDRGV